MKTKLNLNTSIKIGLSVFSKLIIITAALSHSACKTEQAQDNVNPHFERKLKELQEQSFQSKGATWLALSQMEEEKGNHFSSAVLAAKAIGFEGFGRSSNESQQPIYIPNYSKERNRAIQQINEQLNLSHRLLWSTATKRNHKESINDIAYSPNGKILASASDDHTIKLWNTITGKLIHKPLVGHINTVKSVAFSPDGNTIASCSSDKTIRIWDTASGDSIGFPIVGHMDAVNDVIFSPDSKHLASTSEDNTIRIWNLKEKKSRPLIFPLQKNSITAICYSPDGKMLASGDVEGTIKLWDTKTGEIIGSPIKESKNTIVGLAFNPAGDELICADDQDILVLWNVKNQTLTWRDDKFKDYGTLKVVVSGDFKHIASCYMNGAFRIRDIATGKSLKLFDKGHSDWVTSIAFHPKNNIIASSSCDEVISVWDIHTGNRIEKTSNRHTEVVNCVIYSPNGKIIASGSADKSIRLWNTSTGKMIGKPLTGHTGSVLSLAFSPKGELIASGSQDKTIRIWDLNLKNFKLKPLIGHSEAISSIAFNPDGQMLASASWDKTIILWDLRTGKRIGSALTGNTSALTSLTFSPDGKTLFSSSNDKTVLTWDLTETAPKSSLFYKHINEITCLTMDPSGKFLVFGSKDASITFLDSISGEKVGSPLTDHTNEISSLSFSPDGNTLMASSSSTVKVWDVTSRKQIGGDLVGHAAHINDIACSPDGKMIVTGSYDNTVKLWEINAHRRINTVNKRINSLALSPDKKTIAYSESWKDGIKIADLSTGKLITTIARKLRINQIGYSPDGKIIVGSNYNRILFWNAITGEFIKSLPIDHTSRINDIKFSPDGKFIASCSNDKTIRIWDIKNNKLALTPITGHLKYVTCIKYSRDSGTLISGSANGVIRLWDTKTGKQIGKPLNKHLTSITYLDFSPDGKTFVSGSSDSTVTQWDLETNTALSQTSNHELGSIIGIFYALDGKTIIYSSRYNPLSFWDFKTPNSKTILTQSQFGSIYYIEYEKETKSLISGLDSNNIEVIDLEKPNPNLISYINSKLFTIEDQSLKPNIPINSLYEESNYPLLSQPINSLTFKSQSSVNDRIKILHQANNWLQLFLECNKANNELPTSLKIKIAQSLLVTCAHDWSSLKNPRSDILTAKITNFVTQELIDTQQLDLSFLCLASHTLKTRAEKQRNQKWKIVLKLMHLYQSPETPILLAKLLEENVEDDEEIKEWKLQQKKMILSALYTKYAEDILVLRAYCSDLPRSLEELNIRKKIIQLDDAKDQDFNNAGYVAAKLNKPNEVAQIFKAAHKRFPNNQEIFRYEGWSMINIHKYHKALHAFQQALKLNKKPNDDNYLGIAIAHYLTKQPKKAIISFTKAVALDKKWAIEKTITELNWPKIEKDTLLTVFKATLNEHPELKPAP